MTDLPIFVSSYCVRQVLQESHASLLAVKIKQYDCYEEVEYG